MSLIDTTKQLMSFQAVTGDTLAASRMLDWIEAELQPVPVYIKRHEFEGYPALVVTSQKTQKPRLWLAGHVDVVDASPEGFAPVERDHKLYGRGSCDMLFAVAAYIELLKELDLSVREYDFGVMLTSDEETGGFKGARLVLTEGGYTGDLVFLPDGGGPWKFEEAAKGMLGLRVHAHGVTGHGSRPWMGRSAIVDLTAFLDAFSQHFQAIEDACTSEQHWHATVNIDRISGGTMGHQVAAEAEAVIDVRFTSQEELAAIEKCIADLRGRFPHVEVETLYTEPEVSLDIKNGDAALFAAIAREHHGIECGWTRAHGASDARHFSRHGMQTLLVLPQGGGRHSEAEWIDVEDAKRYYEVMKEFVQRRARIEK